MLDLGVSSERISSPCKKPPGWTCLGRLVLMLGALSRQGSDEFERKFAVTGPVKSAVIFYNPWLLEVPRAVRRSRSRYALRSYALTRAYALRFPWMSECPTEKGAQLWHCQTVR